MAYKTSDFCSSLVSYDYVRNYVYTVHTSTISEVIIFNVLKRRRFSSAVNTDFNDLKICFL